MQQTNDIRIKLYPTQHDFFTCEDRFTAFVAGIGAGKTYAGCVKDLHHAIEPNTLGMVIAPTYPMLRDATIRTFLDICGEGVIETFNKAEATVKIRGGGEILFRSADNPDRLRGANLNYAHIDEASMCPPGTWEIIIGRLRAGGKAGACWITTTPKGRNWLYKRQSEMTIFRASTMSNPYLPSEYITSLEQSYSGEFARQELHGEFISLEGLVYKFDQVNNITESSPTTWWLALDEGYTNPAVILLVGMDADGRLHIAKEWYERGKLQADVVAQAKMWHEQYHCKGVIVDSAAAGLIADMRNNGIPAMAASGRVLDGIQLVQNRLAVQADGRARLTVDRSCVNTINEFESYAWKENKDEPVKDLDHSMDAIRYLVSHIDGLGQKHAVMSTKAKIGNYINEVTNERQ